MRGRRAGGECYRFCPEFHPVLFRDAVERIQECLCSVPIFLVAWILPGSLYHAATELTHIIISREIQVRILLQRVKRAAVRVNGHLEASIGPGILAFVGVAATDGRSEADYLATRLVDLRIFPDVAGKMNLAAAEAKAELLVVSQFTLYADCSRGRRPSFERAAPPDQARELYDYFVEKVREKGLATQCGVFQAHMEVELINDGPVTILLEK